VLKLSRRALILAVAAAGAERVFERGAGAQTPAKIRVAAVPIDRIIAMLEGIKAQSGAFRNIFPAGDGTYDVVLANGRYSARIYLGRDAKILGLIFNPR